jgi:hypothetical protein
MVDDRFGDSRSGRRLRVLATSGLSDGEDLVNWTRAWTSRDGRYNVVLAARHRDFVVLTTQRLVLWSCGFFSRRPRRKVFDEPLGRLAVEPIDAGPSGARGRRHLRIRVVSRPPLRFDFGSDGREIAAALLGQASED